MDDIKEKIMKVIDGVSSRLIEKYWVNNYSELHKIITEFSKEISDLPFKQKIWHYINDMPIYFLCSCGNKITFNKNWLDGYRKGCSPKCSQNRDDVKEQRKKTNLEIYGTDNVAKNVDVQKRTIETNLRKYGTKSTFQNKDVQKKWRDNMLEKHGVDHYFKTEEFKDKAKKTSLEKYGTEHYVQSEDYVKKLIETNLEKYGVEFYTQTEEYLEKSKETNRLLYGADWYTQSKQYKDLISTDEFKQSIKDRYLEESKVKYSDEFFDLIGRDGSEFEFFDKRNNQVFKILYDTYIARKQNGYEISTIIKPLYSSEELNNEFKELKDFIDSLGVNYKINDRSLIKPKEIDILIEDYKLCIEYNGLWWHGEFKTDKDYHLNKYKMCQSLGYELFNIWEDDWLYKKDIIKSMIRNKLSKISNKIYARKCSIIKIYGRDKIDFLNKNHIQGDTTSKYNYALVFNNEIVSLMSFSYRHINSKRNFELVRFCSKLDTCIIGGASKLFKYAIKDLDICEIISYADRSGFSGNLYNELGFEFVHMTQPNYWWVIDGIRKNRYNFTKKKLVKLGEDSELSESKIMISKGYFRVWGVGMDKFIYTT